LQNFIPLGAHEDEISGIRRYAKQLQNVLLGRIALLISPYREVCPYVVCHHRSPCLSSNSITPTFTETSPRGKSQTHTISTYRDVCDIVGGSRCHLAYTLVGFGDTFCWIGIHSSLEKRWLMWGIESPTKTCNCQLQPYRQC